MAHTPSEAKAPTLFEDLIRTAQAGQEASLSRTSRYLYHGTAWSDGGHAIFSSD